MLRAFLVSCLAAILLAPLTGLSQAPPAPVAQTEEQRVLATEDVYVAAEINRDEATLRRIVDDRFQFNSANGTTTGKEELIKEVLQMDMVGQTISERSVLLEGDIALVFGTAELRFAVPDKQHSTSTLRYTTTYVRRQGEWRMLALQMQRRVPNQ
jgi:ketosteroid isomerase-like protein